MDNNFGTFWADWQKANEAMLNFWKQGMTPKSADAPKPEQKAEGAKAAVADWLQQQEKALGLYQQWLDFWRTAAAGGVNPENWQQLLQEMTAAWPKLAGQADNPWAKQWSQWLPEQSAPWPGDMSAFVGLIPDQAAREAMGRTMKSLNVFGALLAFWSELAGNMPAKANAAAWDQFVKNAIDNYGKVSETFAQTLFPPEMKDMLATPREMWGTWHTILFDFAKPWLEGQGTLQQKLLAALKGDRAAYADFLREWRACYDQTAGRLAQFPQLGGGKEAVDKWFAIVNAYVRFNVALQGFNEEIARIGAATTEKLAGQVADLTAAGKAPTFREFFKLWSTTNENAYLELFKTEQFGKMMSETVNAAIEFKNGCDELLRYQFSWLPFPSQQETDSLAKAIYELRRTVGDQAREIRALAEKLDRLQGGADK